MMITVSCPRLIAPTLSLTQQCLAAAIGKTRLAEARLPVPDRPVRAVIILPRFISNWEKIT
jgi:hypothetical protein